MIRGEAGQLAGLRRLAQGSNAAAVNTTEIVDTQTEAARSRAMIDYTFDAAYAWQQTPVGIVD